MPFHPSLLLSSSCSSSSSVLLISVVPIECSVNDDVSLSTESAIRFPTILDDCRSIVTRVNGTVVRIDISDRIRTDNADETSVRCRRASAGRPSVAVVLLSN
jgi:hypothetical protein